MEHVYNEFKRNKIVVPYMQVEVRERKENVEMPVIQEPLNKEQTKTRANKKEDTHSEYLKDLSIYTKRSDVPDDNNKKRT